VKGKLPGCNHYLITTFFRPPLRKKRTTLVPPILRPEILEAKVERGEHLLVYQTGESHDMLLKALTKSGLPCRVYGVKRDLKDDRTVGNLVYRPFSEDQFIRDLATSRGVIAGGGFTLMNGRYLEKLGYGRCVEHIDTPDVVHEFIERLPKYERNLEGYHQKGNRKLYEQLDALLDRASAGVL
jgi:hypothetical protein